MKHRQQFAHAPKPKSPSSATSQIAIAYRYFNHANQLHAKGKLAEAERAYRQALVLAPSDAQLWSNLGCVLWKLGRLAEAESSLARAIALSPHLAEPYNNLGGVLEAMGRLDEAAHQYRCSISADPNQARPYCNLGAVLHRLGRFDAAKVEQAHAIKLKPDFAEAWSNLGASFLAQNNFAEAEACLVRAMELSPNHSQVLGNLADVLRIQGKISHAMEIYRKAIRIDRDNLALKVKPVLAQEVILASRESALQRRAEVMASLEDLLKARVRLDDPHHDVGMTNFYFAYQGVNDLELQSLTAKFYLSACPKLGWTAPHCSSPSSANGSRLKIGFVSSSLYEHTIGKFYQGIIRELSRERFEVVVIRPPQNRDPLADAIGAVADRNVEIPYDLFSARKVIASERLDILLYPDVGMTPLTYFLAFARLAPVQCVSWGHPVTTGIPNLDYFISAKSIEPPDAQAHYSERLVLLDRLPTYYLRPHHEANPFTRTEFHLPDDARLYLCPQSLFKLHPDFDVVLATLLRRDSAARLLLLSGIHKHWDRMLAARIAQSFPEVVDRIIFVPRVPQDQFFRLLTMADVILDPPFFGGGNTSYEAFAMGLPIVTWPGEFMRGRVTEGCYRQMGLSDLIADGPDSYVELALRLANDGAWREQMKREIAARSSALYEDSGVVTELEDFLRAAFEAHLRGDRITHWEHA
ncbi:MAG TPA: tetratricopeptide repeat protein [Candidatus Binataceae bacterium]|nr:tetratricopeptide repeat protein [Candidatus Binataceae bacterium]